MTELSQIHLSVNFVTLWTKTLSDFIVNCFHQLTGRFQDLAFLYLNKVLTSSMNISTYDSFLLPSASNQPFGGTTSNYLSYIYFKLVYLCLRPSQVLHLPPINLFYTIKIEWLQYECVTLHSATVTSFLAWTCMYL